MENILLFISNKYIESVKYIRGFIKSSNLLFHYSYLYFAYIFDIIGSIICIL